MAKLFLVGNRVVGPYGHMQIVHASGAGWAGSVLTEVEVQAPSHGNAWDYRRFDQPFTTSGAAYGRVAISLAPGQDAAHVWELIGQIHASMKAKGAGIDYLLTQQNSNSFIRTVLEVIGVDRDFSKAFGAVGLTDFPGWGRNVTLGWQDGGVQRPGLALRLAGTEGRDLIRSGAGDDRLGGQGADDTIRGGAGDDTLAGGTGADRLEGGAGADRLLGGQGVDLLAGGAARDHFVFATRSDLGKGAARDRISDFHHGTDRIDLSALDANTGITGNQAFGWGADTARAHGVWVSFATGRALVQIDFDGDARADAEIALTAVTRASLGDFIL